MAGFNAFPYFHRLATMAQSDNLGVSWRRASPMRRTTGYKRRVASAVRDRVVALGRQSETNFVGHGTRAAWVLPCASTPLMARASDSSDGAEKRPWHCGPRQFLYSELVVGRWSWQRPTS